MLWPPKPLPALSLALFASLVLAAEEPSGAEALKENIREHMHQQVQFTDEMVIVWERQHLPGYLRFDTRHFSCVLYKRGDKWKEIQALLEEILAAPVGSHRVRISGTPFYLEEILDAGSKPPQASDPVPETGFQVMLLVDEVARPSFQED